VSTHGVRSPQSIQRQLALVSAVVLAVLVGLGSSVFLEHEPYSFLWGDATFYANVNRSLAETGTFRQDEMTARSWYYDDLDWNRRLGQEWSNVALGADGESLYPKHHVLLPVAAQPFYLLMGHNGLLFFNVLLMVLSAGLLMVLLQGVGLGGLGGFAVVLLAYLGPAALRDAYHYSNDQFAAFLFLSGYVTLLRIPDPPWNDRKVLLVAAVLGGAAWGALVWAKPVHGMLVVAAGVPLIWRWARSRNVPAFVTAGLGFFTILCVHGTVNWLWFGSPFETSYDRILVREGGVLMLDSARTAFNQDLFGGVHELLFGHRLAFIKGFPVLAFYPAGLLVMVLRRRWRTAALSLLVVSGVILVYGRYDYPSHRFLFPFLFFALAPVAFLANEGVDLARTLQAWLRGGGARGLSRLGAAAGIAVLLLGLLGLAWGRALEELPRPRDLERLRVRIDDRIPCDFFNVKVQRWECSHRDRLPAQMVGAAHPGECAFPGGGQPGSPEADASPWLRLPLGGTWQRKSVSVTAPKGAVGFRYQAIMDPESSRAQKATFGVTASPGATAQEHHFGPPGKPGVEARARVSVREGDEVSVWVTEVEGPRAPVDALCLRWAWLMSDGS
jgi:hypothetical protein